MEDTINSFIIINDICKTKGETVLFYNDKNGYNSY